MTHRSQMQFGSSEGALGLFCFSPLPLPPVCLVFGYTRRPGVAFLFASPLWWILRFLWKCKESPPLWVRVHSPWRV